MKKPIKLFGLGTIASGDRRTDDDVVADRLTRDSKILNAAKRVMNAWRRVVG